MFTIDNSINHYPREIKSYNWGQFESKLKYHYRKENPITTYKLSKEEMEYYLKTGRFKNEV